MVVQEAKVNDKVVTEATVAVATTGCCAISTIRKKLGSFAYSALPSAQIVLLLLKIN
jgi:hypothetical protein